MKALFGWVAGTVAREPVMLGAAVLATFEAAAPDAPPAVKLAAAGWIAWGQRLFSKSKVAAAEEVDAATDAGYKTAIADVSTLSDPIRRQPSPPG